MAMKDERPLGLKELATYDSPEVVSAALGRFRRRLLVRGILFPVIAAAIIFGSKLFPGIGHSPPLQFDRSRETVAIDAPEIRVGPVRFQAIEARRLDENPLFGVRLIASTEALRPNERLSIEEGVTGFRHACEPLGGFSLTGEPSPPAEVVTRGGSSLLEIIVICPLDSGRVILQVGALSGPGGRSVPRGMLPSLTPGGEGHVGPGSYTQDECAVPLNEVGTCAMPKASGTYRSLGTLTLEFESLNIERRIWRTKP
jgi:hypothetical protein